MMTRVYLAILWAGARIVRERDRAEWLAEWQTELWYGLEESGGRRLTRYCLGKRENSGIGRHDGRVLMIADAPGFPEPPAIRCAPLLE